MPGCAASVRRSPVMKISPLIGTFRAAVPLAQSAVPVRSAASELMTQLLSAVAPGFGAGSGAPKRHPAAVQVRRLPVSADEAAASVSEVLAHDATLAIEVPMSGVVTGSAKVCRPPPT